MPGLKRLARLLDSSVEWAGRVAMWGIVPLVLVVCYEVVSRKLFNAPHGWSLSLPALIFGFLWTTAAARTLRHNRHVRIDILTQRLSPRAQTILDLALYLFLFFPVVVCLLVYGTRFAVVAWSTSELLTYSWAFPSWPFKAMIPLMAAMLLIQGVSVVISYILYLARREES
ncbi:TRAP transporter small permease subunit [Chloroflexota bacterium]